MREKIDTISLLSLYLSGVGKVAVFSVQLIEHFPLIEVIDSEYVEAGLFHVVFLYGL